MNRSVEAKDQRPFRQSPGHKLQIQMKINTNRETGEHHQQGVATWPHPGAKTRPKPRFRGFVRELGEAFAPPIFIRSHRLGFSYKY